MLRGAPLVELTGLDMVQGPCVWTDGNLVTDEVSGKYAAGVGVKCA